MSLWLVKMYTRESRNRRCTSEELGIGADGADGADVTTVADNTTSKNDPIIKCEQLLY